MCRSCGGRAKNRPRVAVQQEPPQNWRAKAELDWPLLEFVGNNRNDLVFRGSGGRRYIAGNNQHHRRIRVHPDDYNTLLRLRYFKPAKEPMPAVMKAQAAPRAKPVAPKPERKPKPVDTPKPVENVLELTVAQVRDAVSSKRLAVSNVNLLIEQEETRQDRRPRSTVLRMLRVERRRRSND